LTDDEVVAIRQNATTYRELSATHSRED